MSATVALVENSISRQNPTLTPSRPLPRSSLSHARSNVYITTLLGANLLYGTYFLIGLVGACLVLWPEETAIVFNSVGLKIQLYWLNYRMRRQAYRMYREIVKLSKEAGFPPPGEFRYVNLWDRKDP